MIIGGFTSCFERGFLTMNASADSSYPAAPGDETMSSSVLVPPSRRGGIIHRGVIAGFVGEQCRAWSSATRLEWA